MASPSKTQSAPRLIGVPQEAADEVRSMAQTIYRLEARIRSLEGGGFLTVEQANQMYSPPVMARELSANGSAPLTVTTIGGVPTILAQPTKGRR